MELVERNSSARVVQFLFAPPINVPFGHLGARLIGSRQRMLRELNLRLGEAAADRAAVVDCERIAATAGLQRWFEPRYWHLAREAVAPRSSRCLLGIPRPSWPPSSASPESASSWTWTTPCGVVSWAKMASPACTSVTRR